MREADHVQRLTRLSYGAIGSASHLASGIDLFLKSCENNAIGLETSAKEPVNGLIDENKRSARWMKRCHRHLQISSNFICIKTNEEKRSRHLKAVEKPSTAHPKTPCEIMQQINANAFVFSRLLQSTSKPSRASCQP
jgi:hypothetical protein